MLASMRRWWTAFILCAGLLGCGDTQPAPARPAPPPPAAAPSPEEPAEEPAEEEEPPVEAAPLDVDRMSRPELEAACFQGSQAACDLLGH